MLTPYSGRKRLAPFVAGVIATIVATAGTTAGGQVPQRLDDVARFNAPAIISEVNTAMPNCDNCNFYRNYITDHLISPEADGTDSGFDDVYYMDSVSANQYWRRADTRPVVYYSIEETEHFYFIGYYFYHIRDGGSFIDGVTWDSGHPHDLEGIFLIVQKLDWDPYGHALFAITEAHGALLPFGVPGWTDWNNAQTNVNGMGAFAGQVEYWTDANMNRARPIAAVRSSTHGTYMAQDCSPTSTSYFWDGYGAVIPGSPSGVTACTHRDAASWIYYMPAPYDSYVTNMQDSAAAGTYWYRLEELSSSPMWRLRNNNGALFNGSTLDLDYQQTGLDNFVPYGGANPPWQWMGGAGQSNGYWGHTGYWYSFAMDNTANIHYAPGQWAPLSRAGELLTNAHLVGTDMFGRYVGPWGNAATSFGGPVLYNAFYDYTAPSGGRPLTGEIDGPTTVEPNTPTNYYLSIGNGAPPYTVQWSGLGSGTDLSTTVTTGSPGYLYADVYDAAGGHITLTTYIQTTCADGSITC